MSTETIGQRVKRLREAKGLSQADFEYQVLRPHYHGIVYDVERDDERISILVLKKLAAFFGVTLSYLLEGEPVANTPGKRIRQRRDELGWSVLEARWKVFGSLGVDYCCFESDDCNNAGTFELEWTKIADALGVTL